MSSGSDAKSIEQELEALVAAGDAEMNVGPDGQKLFNLTKQGTERVERMLRENQEARDLLSKLNAKKPS